MKLALIPPFAGLHFLESSNYHLMLPQLLDNDVYSKTYEHLAKTSFVIMDNGAAEGELLGTTELMAAVRRVHPSELVLPDIMRDALGTIDIIKAFQKEIGKHKNFPNMEYMVVAQGKSRIEVQRMVEVVAELPKVTAIGLPRHLLDTLGRNDARLDLAKWLHKHYGQHLSIHFLGASPSWPVEAAFANELGFVRGMDTSMPFNYALHGHLLRDDRRMIKRPENYFEATFSESQEQLAHQNVQVMTKWATGKWVA